MTESLRDTPPLRLLRALHRAFHAVNCADSSRIVQEFGLHQSEFDVVATLGNTEGMPMGHIAARMLTSAGNVTRVVKKLEERGLVTRQRAPWSDRVVLARLTPAGEELFDRTYPDQIHWLEGWFAERLGGPDQEALTVLLERLHGADDDVADPENGC